MINENYMFVNFSNVQDLKHCMDNVRAAINVSNLVPYTSLCMFEGTGDTFRVNVWYFAVSYTMVVFMPHVTTNLKKGEVIAVDAKELSKLVSELDNDSIVSISQTDAGVTVTSGSDTFTFGRVQSEFTDRIQGISRLIPNEYESGAFQLENACESGELIKRLQCIFKDAPSAGDHLTLYFSEGHMMLASSFFSARVEDPFENSELEGALDIPMVNALLAKPWDANIGVKSINGRAAIYDSSSILISNCEIETNEALLGNIKRLYSSVFPDCWLKVDKSTLEKAVKKLKFSSDLTLVKFKGQGSEIFMESTRGSVKLAVEHSTAQDFSFLQTLSLTQLILQLMSKAEKGVEIMIGFDVDNHLEHVEFSSGQVDYRYIFAGASL